MYQVGQTMLIFTQKEQQKLDAKFNPLNIGLEYIAFRLKNLEELQEVEKNSIIHNIQNSGSQIDKSSKKKKFGSMTQAI